MLSITDIKDKLHELLVAYNAGDASPFEAIVADSLPWRSKVLDELKSGRFGQVDVLDVVVEGSQAAEYWVERDMVRDGKTYPEIWGVNFYTFDDADQIIAFTQLEEPSALKEQ